MELTLERLRGEKTLVAQRLSAAVMAYYAEPSVPAVIRVCNELTFACIYNLKTFVPVRLREKDMVYELFDLQKGVYAWQTFIIPQEETQTPQQPGAVMAWRTLLRRAAEDPQTSGLVIDPYPGEQALLFLSRENLQHILENAARSIAALPEPLRVEVEKGI